MGFTSAYSRSARLFAALTVAAAVSGCTGPYESAFKVLVVNRTANTIDALANGNELGQVAAGQTGSFNVSLPESNANIFSNGVAPTPHAKVTLTAKDTRTGALSSEKGVTLIQDSPTTVAFTAADFPSTGPTVARFTVSPTNPTINQDISFNASSSSVTNGTYAWDFGDGQNGTDVTVMHRYTRSGTFTITLTVTSDAKQASTSSRTVTVSGSLPATTANFTFSPTSPAINQDVIFTANGTGVTPAPGNPRPGNPFVPGPGNPGPGNPGPGNPFPGIPFPFPGVPTPGNPGRGAPLPGAGAAIYAWDFGDGTSGVGPSLAHRYAQGGTFAITLRVTTDTGLTATTSRQVTVTTTLPAGSANFVFSPTDPRPDEVVFFNASSSTLSNSTFRWDFGDGSGGSGITPTHSFASVRTYTVTLTVTNDLGQRATTSKTIAVAAPD